MRRAIARINLAAVERNCARLAGALAPGAALGAVVKADGYGHGIVHAARAALAGGATWLWVATAEEAAALRAAGLAARIGVMGALTGEELGVAGAAGAEVVAWREAWVDRLPAGTRVHVKLDTGMGRLGTRDPAEATRVADRVAARTDLELAGAMTHLATADDDPVFMAEQLARFVPWARALRQRHPGIVLHAANSAATLRDRGAHFDLVRCGIAIYGLDPFGADAAAHGLEPALELASWVAALKRTAPGDSAGYGRTWVAARPTWLATLPIGYGDGIRRGLSNRMDAIIAGRRYPLVGTVSMDNVTVDAGPAPRVREGDEAILLGGGQTAEELAATLRTINYEIVCGVSARVPRAYHRDGAPLAGDEAR
jgi:alanine racemase